MVCWSSADAKYRAIAQTTGIPMWIKSLLYDTGTWILYWQVYVMHCYNQVVIHIASNPIFHWRKKHIKHIKFVPHLIRDAWMINRLGCPMYVSKLKWWHHHLASLTIYVPRWNTSIYIYMFQFDNSVRSSILFLYFTTLRLFMYFFLYNY